MTEKTIKLILTVVEAQRRGLPVSLTVLESVYGRNTACWYALRQLVKDAESLDAAYDVLRDEHPERVRVIVSVVK